MKNIYKILIFAFLLRLLVSFLGQHGDVINYYWWTKDLVSNGLLGFYDRNIANAMRPTYPPVTTYLFLVAGYIHNAVYQLFWFLNLHIKLFPSNLIFWMESANGWFIFNKLPAIFSDLGTTYLLYIFGRDLKNERSGIFAALIFAFTPVFWYNSSLWGQTDSVFALPMLAAFYLLYKNKIKTSIVLYGLAVLTKPTALFPLPVYIFWLFKKAKFKEIFYGGIAIVVIALLLYLPFHPFDLVSWIVAFYQRSLGGELGYMVANAFNFWALIFGFDNRPDTSFFLGIPANIVGYLVFVIITVIVLYIFLKNKLDIRLALLAAVVISFAAFIFLPRMHDRYFYPTLVMLVPLAAIDKKLRNVFWAASTIHLINLYHFWWVPKIGFLMDVFSDSLVEKTLIAMNIMLLGNVFLRLLRRQKI